MVKFYSLDEINTAIADSLEGRTIKPIVRRCHQPARRAPVLTKRQRRCLRCACRAQRLCDLCKTGRRNATAHADEAVRARDMNAGQPDLA
jgi:hypothetical protein